LHKLQTLVSQLIHHRQVKFDRMPVRTANMYVHSVSGNPIHSQHALLLADHR